MMSDGLWALGGVLAVAMVIIGLFAGLGDASSGFRVGELQKFSYKGWVWKTYEGQLNLNVASGQYGASTFEFSVCDENPQNIEILTSSAGKRIKVNYRSPLIFWKWNQKSRYCVETIELQ